MVTFQIAAHYDYLFKLCLRKLSYLLSLRHTTKMCIQLYNYAVIARLAQYASPRYNNGEIFVFRMV